MGTSRRRTPPAPSPPSPEGRRTAYRGMGQKLEKAIRVSRGLRIFADFFRGRIWEGLPSKAWPREIP